MREVATGYAAVLVDNNALLAARFVKGASPLVLLPDGGRGYLSKVFNDEWLQENQILEEPKISVARLVAAKGNGAPPSVVQVAPHATVRQALNLMSVLNPRITHTAIDGALFQSEVEAKQVLAVPTVFLNGAESEPSPVVTWILDTFGLFSASSGFPR